jgi:uncharacterized membrane protein YfcA
VQPMRRRRQRKLNIPLIKAIVMFVTGSVIALGTGLTGIAGQIAATPTIDFLLGFVPAKSAATALAFALCAGCAAVLGASLAHVPIDVGAAVLLAVSGAFGAVFVTDASRSPRLLKSRRLAQSVVILLMTLVIREGFRNAIGGPSGLPYAFVHSWWAISVIGLVCGTLSTLLHVSSGVLLVPALIFGVGRRTEEAITIALMVSAIASVLPTTSYASHGLVGRGSALWMMLGGICGGLLGGYWMGAICLAGGSFPLVLFGLVAMFFSAWMIWKMT